MAFEDGKDDLDAPMMSKGVSAQCRNLRLLGLNWTKGRPKSS